MAQKTAREIVVDVLREIESEGAYSNIALKKALDETPDLIIKDKNLITEITNGTIKYKRRIDYVINHVSNTPVNKMKPVIRNVIRMSVYQIIFLDKVPDSAVCNEAVKIVKKRRMGKLSGFVNGVLRNIVRNHQTMPYPDKNTNPVEYLGVIYSFPDWMIKLWLKDYDYDFVEDLCKSLNRAPDVTIRANNLLVSTKKLKESLKNEGVHVEDGQLFSNALKISGGSPIAQLNSFKKGYFTVQDESSMLVSCMLDPQKGETILDACAAPGGKTTHIAQLMENEGKVISADIHRHKLELINKTAKRMKLENVETVLQDATKKNPEYIEKFHRILIDAPCSGLGIIHKKADIRWKKQHKDIKELVKIQKEIVKTCSQYLKPGGVMIYSTCTISPLENEGMVKWILENLDFELDDINKCIPAPLVKKDAQKGYIQIFPADANTDGFFIARLRKKVNNEKK